MVYVSPILNNNGLGAATDTIKHLYSEYDQYLQKHPGTCTTFNNYLNINHINFNSVSRLIENDLELEDDGITGNTFSFNRFVHDKEKGTITWGTSKNEAIQFDTNNMSTNIIDNDELANQYKIASDMYDYVDFGNNSLSFNEISFSVPENGKTTYNKAPLGKNIDYIYREVDTRTKTGQNKLKGIVSDYMNDHYGNLNDLKDIFGEEEGPEANVFYHNDSERSSMSVNQWDSDYNVSYDKTRGRFMAF